jgi:hypothetical protein
VSELRRDGTEAGSLAPARGYTITHPPFEDGNDVALRHGAYSPRRVDPLASELVEAEVARASVEGSATSYLAEPSYRPALWAWGRAEARCQLIVEWLEDKASIGIDSDGEELGALRALARFEQRAMAMRSRLGLDPLSRARLGRDVAAGSVDMAKLMERLAEAERAAEAAG